VVAITFAVAFSRSLPRADANQPRAVWFALRTARAQFCGLPSLAPRATISSPVRRPAYRHALSALVYLLVAGSLMRPRIWFYLSYRSIYARARSDRRTYKPQALRFAHAIVPSFCLVAFDHAPLLRSLSRGSLDFRVSRLARWFSRRTRAARRCFDYFTVCCASFTRAA